MKKILFRKLLFDCLKFFLLTSISISAIVWVFQAVNYLDIMVEDGRNYIVYFKYTMLSLPKIISKISPFALFLSFFYVLSKYEENNELLILWSYGINKIQVINFFIKFSLLIMIFQIVFLSLIVPSSQDLARSTLRNSNINFFDNFLKPKKFNDIIKGVTIYSAQKDKNGKLKNIYIKKDSNQGEFEITYAKNGIIKNMNNAHVLVLYDGENISGKKDNLNTIGFSKSDFNLSILEPNTTTYKKIQENSSIDLFRCYTNLREDNKKKKFTKVANCSRENLHNVLGELYKRIIIPFYIPTLILISLFLILPSKESVNFLKFKIFTFLFGLIAIIFSESTIRFIDGSIISNIKILVIPIFLILILYLTIFYKFNLKYKKF
jgi:lipopolysaccharide export system permease protein